MKCISRYKWLVKTNSTENDIHFIMILSKDSQNLAFNLIF